jgi:hypothetical protein
MIIPLLIFINLFTGPGGSAKVFGRFGEGLREVRRRSSGASPMLLRLFGEEGKIPH